MKQKPLVSIHLIATAIAFITICVFFTMSLYAEISDNVITIKEVKRTILYALPIMIVTMPTLAITGNKLAADKKSPLIVAKLKRMKLIMINGLILVGLAIFLYFWLHTKDVDSTFLIVQILELAFGMVNLILIGLNAKIGLQLSGRLHPKKITAN